MPEVAEREWGNISGAVAVRGRLSGTVLAPKGLEEEVYKAFADEIRK